MTCPTGETWQLCYDLRPTPESRELLTTLEGHWPHVVHLTNTTLATCFCTLVHQSS